jgi:hypothetical protein
MLDREELFQMLARKEWDQIAKVMYSNVKLLGSDPIIQQAIFLFESEFFSETEGLEPREKYKIYEYPGLLIEIRKHGFSESFVRRFIDENLKILKTLKKDNLLNYALSHRESPLAREIIKEIQHKSPEVIANARRENVSIRSTSITDGESRTINLFKSKQEQNFFEAVREAFPTYHPYPNVSISCVLDFDAIKSQLSQQERDYFFRSIVDSVIFDTKDGYVPKFFIELDSSFHDNTRAQENDLMKDSIFKAANTKLIRIRAHHDSETTVQRFKELVLEVMRGL